MEREDARALFGDICRYAGDIDSAGNSLLGIINDILDFSKIEAGKIEIFSAPYKLSSVLNDVSNMILFKARSKDLNFQVEVDETIPDILNGDEVRVRQIITNLLNNAVKYTEQGNVILSVRTGPVRDTGIGIREEDIGRLFAKFERVDLEHNSSIEGTGLGLAITKNLLDLMGGKIDVKSIYGVGSVFTVTLPQTVVSLEPVGNFREKFEQSIQTAKAAKDNFRAPDAHILIVDDTRMNLTVAAGLLKNTGVEIDAVTTGEEAIRLAESIRYDLILMDQRMPVMDGTEALRRIRAQADGANLSTPVICLTADAVSGARERYLTQGFTDYLSKPIDSAALEKMLIRYLPPEKVLLKPVEDHKDAADEAEAADNADLRAVGIDPAAGLLYCQADEQLYAALLQEFAQSSADKTRELRQYYEARDWNNYAVAVHALKSTSRMIGAAALSDAAAALEAAADAGDEDSIRQWHDGMMDQYSAATEVLRRSIGTAALDAADAGADDDILEFLPED